MWLLCGYCVATVWLLCGYRVATKMFRALSHTDQHSEYERENTRNTKIDLGLEEPHSLPLRGGGRKPLPFEGKAPVTSAESAT